MYAFGHTVVQGESLPGLHVSDMKIQDTFSNTSMGEGIDRWRKGKLYKASVSWRREATALSSSSASSEGPEEVRVSARHTGDCETGRSYVPV